MSTEARNLLTKAEKAVEDAETQLKQAKTLLELAFVSIVKETKVNLREPHIGATIRWQTKTGSGNWLVKFAYRMPSGFWSLMQPNSHVTTSMTWERLLDEMREADELISPRLISHNLLDGMSLEKES